MQKKWFFFFLFLLTTLVTYSYLIWSFGSMPHTIFISILFTLILSFPFFRHGPYYKHLTFVSMGYLSFFLIFTIIRDFIALTGLFIPHLCVHLLCVTTFLLGNFLARKIKILELTIPLSDLPSELENIKIAQISDLHIGPTIGTKYVNQAVERINALSPDIIALTGDIGDGPVSIYRDSALPLAHLKSKYGTFFVPGNHEYYWNANEWMNLMNNLRMIVLLNRGKKITVNGKNIFIAGVSDPAGNPGPDLKNALFGSEDTKIKILLSHRPGLAFEAADNGIDLQLSGHTHGGQFFPWTVFVRFFHHHSQGLHKIKKLWLHINVGTGSWGPFLRLGTTPEITLITLVQSNKNLE